VAGKILVHSIPILSLFGSGASHCFVSSRFIALHSTSLICMDYQREISIGNRVITTNRICKACTVELCDKKLEADMLVLDTRGYDVILGMTWLNKYHAVIDCRNKKVIFKIPHQPEF